MEKSKKGFIRLVLFTALVLFGLAPNALACEEHFHSNMKMQPLEIISENGCCRIFCDDCKFEEIGHIDQSFELVTNATGVYKQETCGKCGNVRYLGYEHLHEHNVDEKAYIVFSSEYDAYVSGWKCNLCDYNITKIFTPEELAEAPVNYNNGNTPVTPVTPEKEVTSIAEVADAPNVEVESQSDTTSKENLQQENPGTGNTVPILGISSLMAVAFLFSTAIAVNKLKKD